MRFAKARPLSSASATWDAAIHGLILVGSSIASFAVRRPSQAAAAGPTRPPASDLSKTSIAVALLSGLLPATCLQIWRKLRRRRNRRHVRHPLIEDLISEAAAASAQPLLVGQPAAAFRTVLEEALCTPNHIFGQHLVSAHTPPSNRAAALLACRVEALRRVKAAAAATPQLPAIGADSFHGSCHGAADAVACASNNESSPDPSICKICWDRQCDALLAPCGHLAACLECLAHVQRASTEGRGALPGQSPPSLRCPLCIVPAQDVLRVFA